MSARDSFTVEVTLVRYECPSCHGVYAFSQLYQDQCREHGGRWNCPYCPAQYGWAKGTIQAGKEAAEAAARETALKLRAEQAEAEAARLKARAHSGTCPCCKRTFKQLVRHMQSKHPEVK